MSKDLHDTIRRFEEAAVDGFPGSRPAVTVYADHGRQEVRIESRGTPLLVRATIKRRDLVELDTTSVLDAAILAYPVRAPSRRHDSSAVSGDAYIVEQGRRRVQFPLTLESRCGEQQRMNR